VRKVIFGGGNSVDNFIARSDDAVDFLSWSDEVAEVTAALWKKIDTVLMGRKTWEVAARNGQQTGYPRMKNFVFSRTLQSKAGPQLSIVSEDAAGFVSRLKREQGKDICVMGGGELARSLFEADLIDEVGLNIHPVLLGRGIPLFHNMSRQIDLELRETRVFKNGCVYVLYGVKHGDH
jgi:dihydrofolate reductase